MYSIKRLNLALAVFAFCGVAFAQVGTITSITPEAAAPGDEVVITGTGLGLTQDVVFRATTGGFFSPQNRIATPTIVTPNVVIVTVPLVNAFVPPVAGSSPHGLVFVRDAGGTLSNSTPFFFMEATFGQVTTAGAGTSQSNGLRAATSFTNAGDAPTAGNAAFVLTLDNAVPGSPAILAFGFAANPPFAMVGDGEVVIDILQPFQVLPLTFTVDLAGRIFFPVSIPNVMLNATIAIQWAMVDAGTGSVVIAKGLFAQI
jgi:hypothetical protein